MWETLEFHWFPIDKITGVYFSPSQGPFIHKLNVKSKKPSLLRLDTVLIVCGALLFERVAWILSSEGLHSYPAPCHLLYPLRRSSQARHLGLYSRCLFWEVRGICFWGSSSFNRAPPLLLAIIFRRHISMSKLSLWREGFFFFSPLSYLGPAHLNSILPSPVSQQREQESEPDLEIEST